MWNNAVQIAGSILLAVVPVIVWGYVFYLKKPEKRSFMLITFISGATAVFPILLYKYLWQFFPWINVFRYTQIFEGDMFGFTRIVAIPVSVILTFLIVGVIEEVMKNVAVRVSSHHYLRNIDDAIEFSIIAALGFAFTENIMYFYNIWLHQGMDNILGPFIFRTIFSTFAHVLFSGVFGYFYGIAHFATPILREQLQTKRIDSIFELLYKWRILRGAADDLFKHASVFRGLLIATSLHAVYNIFLEMNWTFALIPFLILGYVYLNHLFDLKQNHKQYNLVFERELT
ncbi:PrsW family intramembrane metalloprotease [Candidatus Peregrinibacteria bacterium]|nr:PrsW family intramembrane metalloprotease [Candidatus Peregrinibacteria bacterium]